jgi:hypothetical protein
MVKVGGRGLLGVGCRDGRRRKRLLGGRDEREGSLEGLEGETGEGGADGIGPEVERRCREVLSFRLILRVRVELVVIIGEPVVVQLNL